MPDTPEERHAKQKSIMGVIAQIVESHEPSEVGEALMAIADELGDGGVFVKAVDENAAQRVRRASYSVAFTALDPRGEEPPFDGATYSDGVRYWAEWVANELGEMDYVENVEEAAPSAKESAHMIPEKPPMVFVEHVAKAIWPQLFVGTDTGARDQALRGAYMVLLDGFRAWRQEAEDVRG